MKVRWSRRALADLARMNAYLADRNPAAARRVEARIRKRVNELQDFPLSCPRSGIGQTRQLVVTRTPHIVLYKVEGDLLSVDAVFHAAQDRRQSLRRSD
ncbi:MAG: type II toxin-antitoxin system RelE/ParE family toxin [Hyphomonadaceae bacterium]|nr:type II toxin-antitoxin system RelE/ParE family toxin [Hyphomonadaceae bacterium]